MIRGIGIDICDIERIERACKDLGEGFLDRLFTKGEKAYGLERKNPFPHLAGMFAAKEAARKGFGERLTGIGWTDIEVVHLPSGMPSLAMHGKAYNQLKEMDIQKVHLSISHEKKYAIAMVIYEGDVVQ
jgi:holo-[acyl-carrier protein] synthase